MRASLSAGGTSPAAMRCASPSTIAVLPTPALPTNPGLFFPWRSRMSTTRAISASRQRTGSRSPRRARAVRSIPTRSSTSVVSNNPSKGSPMPRSVHLQEVHIPRNHGVSEHERHRGREGEEDAEGELVPPPLLDIHEHQRQVERASQQRRHEDRQQRVPPSDER